MSCDLGWRGDRSIGPSSLLAIRFLLHSCLGPEEFFKAQAGFLQCPMAVTTSCPRHTRHLPEVIQEQKPNKNKQKETQGDLQSLLAVVTVNPEAKTCQKVGQGVAGARQGAGKHRELACRQREGAKYPQTSFLSEINLLTETALSKNCD